MLVDEKFIIEELPINEQEFRGDVPGVQLRYNQTNPNVIRDGIDFITVIEEFERVYRIDYWGYAFGRLRVTADGIEQLGQDLLNHSDTVPKWTIDPETVNADNLPWWVPDEMQITPTVKCVDCDSEVSVREVVTLKRQPDIDDRDVFCRECWQDQ